MTFRLAANIDANQHKGLILLNSISGSPLVVTGKSLTNSQPMHVAIVDGVGSQITSFGGGTQYAEGTTTSPGTGTLSIGRYMATPPSLTDGQMEGLQLDSAGNLKITGSLSVGGTTDNSAFTAGTSTGTPTMGFYHSTIDTVTDGRAAAVGITSKRAMLVTLQTSAGADTGVAASPLQVSLANTAANATAVKVDGSAVTQPISGTVTIGAGSAVIGHVITDTGSTTAVTGTVTISGAVTEATLDAALISQEATTSGVKGLTVFGAVTTNAPTYTTAKSDALSLDTSGLLRVSLKDTPANTNKLLVTPDALPANQSVNVSQINAVTPLMGNGNTGTGSQRVTIAADNTAFAVNATLSAETTKVIGTVRNSDGAGNLWTSNSTTYTAKFAQDSNLLGTLGTAFSTAGKVDIKGADGDVFVRNATAGNFLANVTLQTQTDTVMVGGVNVKEFNGVAPLMGVGATGTGAQRMVVANDNGKTVVSAGGSAASSGNNTLVAAGTNRLKVKAFSLTTTSTTAMTCIFQSGAGGTELWRVIIQAPSGASAGANLAVNAPDWLFATASATLLNLNLSSANAVHWSVSYYDEV